MLSIAKTETLVLQQFDSRWVPVVVHCLTGTGASIPHEANAPETDTLEAAIFPPQ